MPDPIRIEEAFHEAVEAIESAGSFRYIYSCFFSFTFQLEGEYLKYQSYLHQLMDLLPLYTLPVTWSGLDPEQLKSDAEKLQNISEGIQTDVCEDVIQRLREVSFLQYICISEPVKADYLFESLTGTRLLKEKAVHVKGTTCSNLSYVQQLISGYSERTGLPQSAQKTISRLLNDIRRMLNREGNTMLIPVVEEALPGMDDNREVSSGRLRRIRLRDSGGNSEKDSIIRHYPVLGAEPVSNVERPAITSWGRKKAEDKSPVLKQKFFNATLHYDINEASHIGESGSMAVSAMWYTFLLEKANLRERFVLAGDAAMTGDVDKDGIILPVDPEGIEYKTEAAFFSWANLLVVPAQQLQEFEECLKKLTNKYPDRKLTLIGVENLDSIFYDRRLSNYVVESRFKRTLKKFKKEKFKTVGVPVILVLLLVIARLMYGPVDRNPVSLEIAGNTLFLQNQSGINVASFDLDESTAMYQENSNRIVHYPLFQLLDLNDDGFNELFYARRAGDETIDIPVVRAWSVSGDSLIWETDIEFNYNYPKQNLNNDSGVRINEIGVVHSQNGMKIIVNASSRMYFYSFLVGIAPLDGSIEKEFVHPGRINDMFLIDLNNTGEENILIGGINNAYWLAFFSNLSYKEMSGYSPVATDDYIPSGLEKALVDEYILIPKSILGKYFNPVYKYNSLDRIIFIASSFGLQLIVSEGNTNFSGEEYPLRVLFDLNENLKPVGIGTFDIYDIYVRNLYKEGKIPFEPDYDYFEALQDSILYWTGEEFVPTQEYFSQQGE